MSKTPFEELLFRSRWSYTKTEDKFFEEALRGKILPSAYDDNGVENKASNNRDCIESLIQINIVVIRTLYNADLINPQDVCDILSMGYGGEFILPEDKDA